MIDSLPQIAAFAVDLHEHLVEMPPPVAGPHALDAALSVLSREDRTKAEPPEPNRLVADVDAALVKKILDVPQRERERTNIMTASRMISGLLWKYLKGSRFVMAGGYEAALPFSNGFLLTAPTNFL